MRNTTKLNPETIQAVNNFAIDALKVFIYIKSTYKTIHSAANPDSYKESKRFAALDIPSRLLKLIFNTYLLHEFYEDGDQPDNTTDTLRDYIPQLNHQLGTNDANAIKEIAAHGFVITDEQSVIDELYDVINILIIFKDVNVKLFDKILSEADIISIANAFAEDSNTEDNMSKSSYVKLINAIIDLSTMTLKSVMPRLYVDNPKFALYVEFTTRLATAINNLEAKKK